MYTLDIARRLFLHSKDEERFSRPAITVAIAGVAVGVCVMILSVCVTLGFQSEIRQKVIGFGGHIQVFNAESHHSEQEDTHITADSTLLSRLAHLPRVVHAQRFCQKPGMLKTDESFRGVAFRGIGQEYDTIFLASHLVEGRLPYRNDSTKAEELLISSRIASQLKIQLGDRIYAYFFEQKVKARRFTVVGIYNTHLSDFDQNIVFTPIGIVQKLWGWTSDQCTGVELKINDFEQLDVAAETVSNAIDLTQDAHGTIYRSAAITSLHPSVFAWLELLDMNVWVILALMVCVAGFTMVSGLLIVILERTNFIGVMKAMGATNRSIRHIFLFFAVFVIGLGLAAGNVLALGLMTLQEQFHLVHLNPQDYYVDTVPLTFQWGYIALINIATLAICMLALLAPSYLISNIHPVRSIRFE